MRVGLYGGGFDPIHNGHIGPVWEAKRALKLDRVIYLPTACPPHKQDRVFAPAHARYAMVELALLWEAELFASPFELREGEPSYTIDTLRHFGETLPGAELVLLLGSDAFAQLSTWRDWRDILVLAEIAVMMRPGWEPDRVLDSIPEDLRAAAFDEPVGRGVRFVENRRLAASSTDIRAQLAQGQGLASGLVPSLVLDYIRKYELYQ